MDKISDEKMTSYIKYSNFRLDAILVALIVLLGIAIYVEPSLAKPILKTIWGILPYLTALVLLFILAAMLFAAYMKKGFYEYKNKEDDEDG